MKKKPSLCSGNFLLEGKLLLSAMTGPRVCIVYIKLASICQIEKDIGVPLKVFFKVFQFSP